MAQLEHPEILPRSLIIKILNSSFQKFRKRQHKCKKCGIEMITIVPFLIKHFFDNLLCANQDDRFVSSTIRQRVTQPADTGTSSFRVLEVHASEYLSPCIFIELFTSSKIKKRDYRCGRREATRKLENEQKLRDRWPDHKLSCFPRKKRWGSSSLYMPPSTMCHSLQHLSPNACPDVHFHYKVLRWQQRCDSAGSHLADGPGSGSCQE